MDEVKTLCEEHNLDNETIEYRFYTDAEIKAREDYRHIQIYKVSFFDKVTLEQAIEEAVEHERSLY